MMYIDIIILWILFIHHTNVFGQSYHQPKFCPNATWNSDGTTFVANAVNPFGIFIDKNNTIYVNEQASNRVTIWTENSTTPIRILNGSLNWPGTTFVANNGDIYVDNGFDGDIVIWRTNGTVTRLQLGLIEHCLGLFIDNNNFLYCSNDAQNKIMKMPLNSTTYSFTIVAGTGVAGSTAQLLDHPNGIFVDENSTLYVADCYNGRVQRFYLGQNVATTVVGNGASNTISLLLPTGVTLDVDGYLWIADAFNNRIVGSGPYGFRCIVGCSGSSGSTSTTLQQARTFAFDRFGNIYVADTGNNRVQRFILMVNPCNSTTTTKSTTTTSTTTTTTSTTTTTTSTTTTTTSTTTTSTTTTRTSIMQDCDTPDVTLVPGDSTLHLPLQFQRSQNFHIFSIIDLNCNVSLAITTQWNIKNCSTNCSNQIQLDPTVTLTFSELYIPAQTLLYGTYELQLTVFMTIYPLLKTSISAYVHIIPSGITANLVQLGTSVITSGHEQDLKLDPGTHSIDLDESNFNSTNWIYNYYCRIYPQFIFPSLPGLLLTVNDLRNDSLNPSCLSNRTGWIFGNSFNSSLTILSGSLKSNQTYQFMVQTTNRQNTSQHTIGYVLVKIVDTRSHMITIGCVIVTMCAPHLEYQRINSITQVSLFSIVDNNNSIIQNITWNIYSGAINSSGNNSQWILFNQTNIFVDKWFFGRNTSNFTATKQLFLNNPEIKLWRFEVIYSFLTDETSICALNFLINQPPSNGSCLISPQNGTTSTLFTISCLNWFDDDDIKDYSIDIWINDLSEKFIIAFSPVSIFQVRLPAGTVHLSASIRDQLNSITEYNMSSIIVLPDSTIINDLITNLQISSMQVISNPIVQLLASTNQNIVGQMITSLSQEFNRMNTKNINTAVSNGIPIGSISISSLGSQCSLSIGDFNQSALIEFIKQLNSLAIIREYIISFTTNLPITSANHIKLQSSSLAQLTKSTNQLTRKTISIASEKCYKLSQTLYSMSNKIAYEDIEISATQLIQCAANILSAVNALLQQRTNRLESDIIFASAFPDDYDTDLESEQFQISQMTDDNKNIFYQKQLANQIENKMKEILSKLTTTLHTHLNIGQQSIMNTSQVFMSLEIQSIASLSNKQIQQIGNASISLPSTFQTNISINSKVSIRSTMEPLASYGNSEIPSNTNFSTSVSLSIVDKYENEIPIEANDTHPIEIIIPRDPNLIIPPMIIQNVTSLEFHQQLFNLHYVNITNFLPISIHFELHVLDMNLSYLLIYKFDQIPQLNNSINQIDGWSIFCSSNLSNKNIYTFFLDNHRTQNHQSLVFGLRELNTIEANIYCSNFAITSPPITDEKFIFTSNYELRIYSSGCYYLDKNNQWKGDGLRVGPLTNHNQTQCFSNHLPVSNNN